MTKEVTQEHLDLITDMLLILCSRNLQISFPETKEFERRYATIKEKSNNVD